MEYTIKLWKQIDFKKHLPGMNPQWLSLQYVRIPKCLNGLSSESLSKSEVNQNGDKPAITQPTTPSHKKVYAEFTKISETVMILKSLNS